MEAIRYWTEAALEANRREHTIPNGTQKGPFRSARALGMTLIAMHDTFFSITAAGDPPYLPAVPPAPPGALPRDAMAVAACRMLHALYPAQSAEWQDAWAAFLADNPVNAASTAAGTAVANAVLAWRAADEPLLGGSFAPTGLPYDHDVDPMDPAQGFAGPLWGAAAAFAVGLQPLAPPPGAGAAGAFTPGPHYLAEFAEVKDKGVELGGTRTADEEEIGIFWGYDGPAGLGTPPRLYMQVALEVLDGIAARPGSWVNDRHMLRVLTACAVAMADAGIQAWHYKYSTEHMLWRPVLGVRRAADPGTPPDPTWRPLGRPATNGTALAVTPNFPAYPSGHATFGAATFEVLRRYIRRHDNTGAVNFADTAVDNIRFTFVSDEYDGRSVDPRTGRPRPRRARSYDSLWQAIVENSESRIFLGVHWRFDGISRTPDPVTGLEFGRPDNPGQLGQYGGVKLGMDIARQLATARGFA